MCIHICIVYIYISVHIHMNSLYGGQVLCSPAMGSVQLLADLPASCARSECKQDPEVPSTQYFRTLVPKTIPLMVFGTQILGTWTLWVNVWSPCWPGALWKDENSKVVTAVPT